MRNVENLETVYTEPECRCWPQFIFLQYLTLLCNVTYRECPVFTEDSEDAAVFMPSDCLTCPTNGVEDNKGWEKA
jgi:hypothetical protein